MALPANASPINTSDTISDTIKTTEGYFTDGDTSLEGVNVFTGSSNSSMDKYYFNVVQTHTSHSTAATQFSVTFGHVAGSGSDQFGDSTDNNRTIMGATKAIYGQLSNILQHENEISGGFKISQQGSAGAVSTNVRDDYVYALIGKRARFKDRMNKKNWTLMLSGSDSYQQGVTLHLTDDSKTEPGVSTPGGIRYNIVSGSDGTPYTSSAYKTYGWFYPERGIMLFSGPELSASMPGRPYFHASESLANVTASFGLDTISSSFTDGPNLAEHVSAGDVVQFVSSSGITTSPVRVLSVTSSIGTGWGGDGESHLTASAIIGAELGAGMGVAGTDSTGSLRVGVPTTHITASFVNSHFGPLNAAMSTSLADGFAPNLYAGANSNPMNALRFVNCMTLVTESVALRMRSEEDKTEENYFCRIRAEEYNFSNNPTFVSGSKNKISNTGMFGNPTTFITGIGLYNSAGQLLAIAELSKPMLKDFATEATIKVRLTY